MDKFRYDTIDDLNKYAEEFHLLTRASPNIASETLHRLFRDVSTEDLQEFGSGRRQTIYALEYLLKFENTFWIAAHALRQLAVAENETWSNNATGVWEEIFSTRFAGTPVPALERLKLIHEALESNSSDVRLVGVKALGKHLNNYEGRHWGFQLDGYIAPPEWQPSTWKEYWDVKLRGLRYLEQVLNDTEPTIVEEAQNILFDTANWQIFQAPDFLLNTIESIEHTDTTTRRTRRTLQQILKADSEKEQLETSLIQRIEQILTNLDNSYGARLHRWVGNPSWEDRVKLDKNPEILSNLVEEGLKNPKLLTSELAWLISSTTEFAYVFGQHLGLYEEDGNHTWLKPMIDIMKSVENPNHSLLIGYLIGQHNIGETGWVEGILNDWIENDQLFAITVFYVVIRSEITVGNVEQVLKLIDKGWLELDVIGNFEFERLADKFLIEELQELFDRVINANTIYSVNAGLNLLHRWVDNHPSMSGKLLDKALFLIGRRITWKEENSNKYDWYAWERVATAYVASNPLQVAHKIFPLFERSALEPFGPQDTRLVILREALRLQPEEIWNLIGEQLLADSDDLPWWPARKIGWDKRRNDTSILFEVLEVDMIMDWIHKHGLQAARTLARYVHIAESPLPKLARQLLMEYGNDEIVRKRMSLLIGGYAWSGRLSDFYQGLLEMVREWMSDPDYNVAEWAHDLAIDLESRILEARVRDDEEELRW